MSILAHGLLGDVNVVLLQGMTRRRLQQRRQLALKSLERRKKNSASRRPSEQGKSASLSPKILTAW